MASMASMARQDAKMFRPQEVQEEEGDESWLKDINSNCLVE